MLSNKCVDSLELNTLCVCGKFATLICTNCKRHICEDNNCGLDTVDGYLCGSYTQWGCGRKYTTCDECLDDKAIHEGDLEYCEECNIGLCEVCEEKHECESSTSYESTSVTEEE